MQRYRKLITGTLIFVLAMLCMTFYVSDAQESETRLAHSNGKGTLKVADQQFQISGAVVKLLPDRKAEITLLSDITVFVEGTWSNRAGSEHEFDLEITGGASPGGLDGKGQVFLSDDSKSVKKLTLKGISRTTKRAVEAEFEGK